MEKLRKFIIAKLLLDPQARIFIRANNDESQCIYLRTESFAITNLRGVSTKLNYCVRHASVQGTQIWVIFSCHAINSHENN